MARTKAEGGISGLQKAAILLISLGPERSAGIFKHLKEEEIEELTLEIANTRSVTPQVKEEVINEFYEVCLAQQYIAEGGINYAKELLEKALGSDKAMDVIGKLTASLQVKPFEFVRKTDASQLINFIQDEHPQTIALILSYLSPSQAALIISATRQPGRGSQTYCSHGSYQSGCHQGSGKSTGVQAGKSGESGLHHYRWCGCSGGYPEYCRPWYRETYHGDSGDRRARTGRRDPKKDVRFRGHIAPGRQGNSACAA